MKKKFIVKENDDFNAIIAKQQKIKSKYFVIIYEKNELNHSRFGISVGKKLGNAVIRNKMKRKVRNILDNYKFFYSNPSDYIIIIRKEALSCPFEKLNDNLLELLNRLNK